MTSWFSTGNDTAERLKAFIKDHLGTSGAGSIDDQGSMDAEVHPFDLDSSTRHGLLGGRQETVIHVDVRPKMAPTQPAVALPTRENQTYDFRKTDMRFNEHAMMTDYVTQSAQSYREYDKNRQNPQLSPPLKAISKRLEKQTTWDKGKDYLASMSDSDSDQSLSSHDLSSYDKAKHASASAESRAYFKTFNKEKFVSKNNDSGHDSSMADRSAPMENDNLAGADPYRHSSQARPLVIPDRTDIDDGYGSVENSSSGTASSDSSSSSNTPERQSPGGSNMVARRREAFRRSTKKKGNPSVQEKLKKLCIQSETVRESGPGKSLPQSQCQKKSYTDIARCFKCGKEKGVPHLLHMYDANSICVCETSNSSYPEIQSSSSRPGLTDATALQGNVGIDYTTTKRHMYGTYDNNKLYKADNQDDVKQVNSSFTNSNQISESATTHIYTKLGPLPNRTRLQTSHTDTLASKRVNFRFNTSNPSSNNVPLRADHSITVTTNTTLTTHTVTSDSQTVTSLTSAYRPTSPYPSQTSPYPSQMSAEKSQHLGYHGNDAIDSRHRDWLLEQNAHLHQNQEHINPVRQPSYPDCQQDQVVPSQSIVPDEDYVDGALPLNSQSSQKLLTSQKLKHDNDYARFKHLLEQAKAKEPERVLHSKRPSSPPVQFMKSSEIYQRLADLRPPKSNLRRVVSAPQSPVKNKPNLRGAWSEDSAILVRAPLPAGKPRDHKSRDPIADVISNNVVVTEEQLRIAHNLQDAHDKLAQLATRRHQNHLKSRLATDF